MQLGFGRYVYSRRESRIGKSHSEGKGRAMNRACYTTEVPAHRFTLKMNSHHVFAADSGTAVYNWRYYESSEKPSRLYSGRFESMEGVGSRWIVLSHAIILFDNVETCLLAREIRVKHPIAMGAGDSVGY